MSWRCVWEGRPCAQAGLQRPSGPSSEGRGMCGLTASFPSEEGFSASRLPGSRGGVDGTGSECIFGCPPGLRAAVNSAEGPTL